MLEIPISEQEYFDDTTERFVKISAAVIQLEHSLVSLSKWESIWCVPFLKKADRTEEETLSYLQCMLLNPEHAQYLSKLTEENYKAIHEYINSKQTATILPDTGKSTGPKETFTAELFYYWMFSLGIPLECQDWHLNRLLTLIRIFDIKNSKPKKLTREEMQEQARKNHELNEARMAEMGTNG